MAFRRFEDRGEIRGGRFVDGFLGEQFALPVAVESVRSTRKLPRPGDVTLSAADPLNLVGILVPGERVPAISGKAVSFRDGVAELPTAQESSQGHRGDRLTTTGRKLHAKGGKCAFRFEIWPPEEPRARQFCNYTSPHVWQEQRESEIDGLLGLRFPTLPSQN